MSKLTDRQLALLSDLHALEKAKLIYPGGQALAYPGYDEGSTEVEIPGILTPEGEKVLTELHQSRRTLTL